MPERMSLVMMEADHSRIRSGSAWKGGCLAALRSLAKPVGSCIIRKTARSFGHCRLELLVDLPKQRRGLRGPLWRRRRRRLPSRRSKPLGRAARQARSHRPRPRRIRRRRRMPVPTTGAAKARWRTGTPRRRTATARANGESTPRAEAATTTTDKATAIAQRPSTMVARAFGGRRGGALPAGSGLLVVLTLLAHGDNGTMGGARGKVAGIGVPGIRSLPLATALCRRHAAVAPLPEVLSRFSASRICGCLAQAGFRVPYERSRKQV